MRRIIDTNVLVVAHNKSPQASTKCVNSCAQFLETVKKSGILVIDDRWRILKEYQNNVFSSGQPTVGYEFLRWVLTNRTNPKHCEQVSITRISEYEFEEFPKSESLMKFDPADRKFVAVALTHPQRPAIANAVDPDWRDYEIALADHGVKVDFLCPELCPKD